MMWQKKRNLSVRQLLKATRGAHLRVHKASSPRKSHWQTFLVSGQVTRARQASEYLWLPRTCLHQLPWTAKVVRAIATAVLPSTENSLPNSWRRKSKAFNECETICLQVLSSPTCVVRQAAGAVASYKRVPTPNGKITPHAGCQGQKEETFHHLRPETPNSQLSYFHRRLWHSPFVDVEDREVAIVVVVAALQLNVRLLEN